HHLAEDGARFRDGSGFHDVHPFSRCIILSFMLSLEGWMLVMAVADGRDHRYKLLVLDVDGTLLTSQAQISPRTRAALDRARKAGMAISLATGRRLATVRPQLADLGITLPVILQSG